MSSRGGTKREAAGTRPAARVFRALFVSDQLQVAADEIGPVTMTASVNPTTRSEFMS